MLIRSSLPGSTEAALSLTSGNGEQELIRDWTAGGGSLHEIGCTEREDIFYPSSSSQRSTMGTVSETSLVTSVYKRRKLRDGSSYVFPDQASTEGKPMRSFFSEISCEDCCQEDVSASISRFHETEKVTMVMCDQCEEVFDTSCCNMRVTKIPRDKCFCPSCLKKHYRALKKTASDSVKGKGKVNKYRSATSRSALGPIARMLDEDAPYTSNVRVGSEFQAEVPVRCGPVASTLICSSDISEPVEYPSVGVSSQVGNSKKNIHISISNWLQCRQVLYGLDAAGTVCGKWRRAPLFERQTDKWECSDSLLWDPAHADCGVPQELDTEQVLKDLKYIKTLRPQLDAEKRKVDRTKHSVRKGKGPAKRVGNMGAL